MARALPQPSNHSLPRVVIVDDHPTFRLGARMLLAARGYDVVADARSAATALNAFGRHTPQAVLLDVRLGDDDGFELCHLLTRSRPELAILLTSSDDHDPKLVTRCGARGLVQKHRLYKIDFGHCWPPAGPCRLSRAPSQGWGL